MDERILITGGGGFIGSHLAKRHLAEGDDVHLLVRYGGASRPDRIKRGATVHEIDLSDIGSVEDCLAAATPTIIYHLAGGTGRENTPGGTQQQRALIGDLENLIVLLDAAAKVRPPIKAFVRAGSLAEYGNGPTPSREDQREQPIADYTGAMVAGAHYCSVREPNLPFPIRTARLALTYGPGQSRDFLVPWLIDRCLAGEASAIDAPSNRRDMVFVEDAVDGLRKLAASDNAGTTIVNLASGLAPTVKEIAEMVARACRFDPARLTFGHEPGHGARTIWGSNERAFALLGWRPATSLRDGLAHTVQAHRASAERAVAA